MCGCKHVVVARATDVDVAAFSISDVDVCAQSSLALSDVTGLPESGTRASSASCSPLPATPSSIEVKPRLTLLSLDSIKLLQLSGTARRRGASAQRVRCFEEGAVASAS